MTFKTSWLPLSGRRVPVKAMRFVFRALLSGARRTISAVALVVPLRRSTAAQLLRAGDGDVVVWVAPSRIRKQVARDAPVDLGRGFLVRSPAWEADRVQDVGEGPTAITMRQLLVEHRHPRETDQHARMVRAIRTWRSNGEDGKPVGAYWCRSEADVDDYFDILLRACSDIRENGYRTQAELRRLRPQESRHRRDEIQVTIGYDGTPHLLRGGTHRTLIAQHYELAAVPVRIMSVSYSWAKRHLRPRTGSLTSLLQVAIDADAVDAP